MCPPTHSQFATQSSNKPIISLGKTNSTPNHLKIEYQDDEAKSQFKNRCSADSVVVSYRILYILKELPRENNRLKATKTSKFCQDLSAHHIRDYLNYTKVLTTTKYLFQFKVVNYFMLFHQSRHTLFSIMNFSCSLEKSLMNLKSIVYNSYTVGLIT
jgi:hypothetical protein